MSFKKIFLLLVMFFSFATSSFATEKPHLKTDLQNLFVNNKAVIYALNLRTFNADDKNGNGIIDIEEGETAGSFINAIDRLDELKELGINTIHLLPITPVGKIKALGTAGSVYAMSDFTSLNLQLVDANCELSPKEQAKKFIDECHNRGIRVIVDLPSCGAYDMYLNNPDLFVQDVDGSPFIPADWADVRLFNVPDTTETLLSSDIYFLHKVFVVNMINLGVDGIRADVATLKPFVFWKELISFARSKKEGFMFLAEASENWTKPASDKAYFTDYKKLLEAGFDGYYGNYFDLKNWNTMDCLVSSVQNQQKVFKKHHNKKSVIGSFETHDEVSPLIIGGENFSKIIIWLNATLPLNPYYVDGFLQGDDYSYDFANKKADETYTDDEYYYVHKGQIDIFNFSRRPDGDLDVLKDEHKLAMKLRNEYLDVISQGKFIPLKTNNNKIFAYQRILKDKSVVVIINRNLVNTEKVRVKLKKNNKKSHIKFVKDIAVKNLYKSTFEANMKPAAIAVFTIN